MPRPSDCLHFNVNYVHKIDILFKTFTFMKCIYSIIWLYRYGGILNDI